MGVSRIVKTTLSLPQIGNEAQVATPSRWLFVTKSTTMNRATITFGVNISNRIASVRLRRGTGILYQLARCGPDPR